MGDLTTKSAFEVKKSIQCHFDPLTTWIIFQFKRSLLLKGLDKKQLRKTWQ